MAHFKKAGGLSLATLLHLQEQCTLATLHHFSKCCLVISVMRIHMWQGINYYSKRASNLFLYYPPKMRQVWITSLISLPLIFMFDPEVRNNFLGICDAWSDRKRVRGNSGREQELENISQRLGRVWFEKIFWEKHIDDFREKLKRLKKITLGAYAFCSLPPRTESKGFEYYEISLITSNIFF